MGYLKPKKAKLRLQKRVNFWENMKGGTKVSNKDYENAYGHYHRKPGSLNK